ncbi:hypothetical protein EK904_007200 [Melospiza melodia maxima]|nr:hypothetical protein EK904_007200 [Melospiza melodia maxima]
MALNEVELLNRNCIHLPALSLKAWARLDKEESLDSPGQMAFLVIQASQDQGGNQVMMAVMGQQVTLVTREPLDSLVSLVALESLGIQGSLVFQDLRVRWVFKDLQVQEDSEEDQDHQDPQGPQDHKATGDLASLEKKVNRVKEEILDQEEKLDFQVFQDMMVHLVVMVPEEARGSLARWVLQGQIPISLPTSRGKVQEVIQASQALLDSQETEETREILDYLVFLDFLMRMGISQACLEKWDQKVKRVKLDLLLILRDRLGFQARMAHLEFLVHLVLLEPLDEREHQADMVCKVSLGQEDKKDLKVKKGIALHAFWVRNSEGALLAPVALLAFQEPLASLEAKENLVIKDHMVFLASLEQK